MLNELLLSARGVAKVYTGTQHPMATLRQALFGIPAGEVDQYPVLRGIHLDIIEARPWASWGATARARPRCWEFWAT